MSLSIESINPIRKYPHIPESYACILKMFACMFLLPINFLISFGIYSTSKLSKQVTLLFQEYRAIQSVPMSECSSGFINYAPSFNLLDKLSLE